MIPTSLRFATAFGVLLAFTAPLAAQQATPSGSAAYAPAPAPALDAPDPAVPADPVEPVEATEPTEPADPADPAQPQDPPPPPTSLISDRPITIQHFRPMDRRGINVFETPKEPGVEFDGFRIEWNAAFTQQLQNLDHSNQAVPVVANNVNVNQLKEIGLGFNNATANLYMNAQLARGLRVALTAYLSSRHHQETWVKDGYLLVDASPIDFEPLHKIMQYVTMRIGHFEINYGDAHFRRTDNGHALYNPLVGNYMMDAFTTEIGAEVYVRHNGIIAMGGVTSGTVRGTVLNPTQRAPAYLGKLGFDRQLNPDLRVRLTGSMYRSSKSDSNTLYGGDRAGSRYYFVLENTAATETAQFTSGRTNPGFRNSIRAFQINPFVKMRGLEVFGVLERAEGKTFAEAADRRFDQQAVDVVYRFANDAFYGAARYNRIEGRPAGLANDITGERWQIGGGWFISSSLLMKLEYVNQEFSGYPPTNIRHGGKFNGMMLEAVVAF
jgi:hypothetical protein